jgi:hypothetical protein
VTSTRAYGLLAFAPVDWVDIVDAAPIPAGVNFGATRDRQTVEQGGQAAFRTVQPLSIRTCCKQPQSPDRARLRLVNSPDCAVTRASPLQATPETWLNGDGCPIRRPESRAERELQLSSLRLGCSSAIRRLTAESFEIFWLVLPRALPGAKFNIKWRSRNLP